MKNNNLTISSARDTFYGDVKGQTLRLWEDISGAYFLGREVVFGRFLLDGNRGGREKIYFKRRQFNGMYS
ncbi:MAG: hypothetical protein ACFFCW_14110 [Candidatus Hodarchaeota archaeon]